TFLMSFAFAPCLVGAPADVSFSQPAPSVEAYDFLEIAAQVERPDVGNPFTEAALTGSFGKVGEQKRIPVDGFCDSTNGAIFRIRFMPSAAGDYAYTLAYRQGNFEKTHSGTFNATPSRRKGPIRVDPKYPWHFIWEGTGEHYYFNGTTAFWLMGWREDR